ncbi:MAG TPA: methyl-accepting chemotaxis protein [Xanthobacteraceae bacterium]|jgi:methyl-accepting chemotaxis protein|nr:methyl-accepting chemotaxis protein [Xanthobacteraceae bacterium]
MTFGIRARLYGIVFVFIAGLIAVSWLLLNLEFDALKNRRQQELKELVETAMSAVNSQYAAAKSGAITEAEAKSRAAQAVGQMRYQDDNYFWINDLHPTMVMHPTRPDLNGKDLTAIKDPNGLALFVAFADVAKAEGSGFVNYMWPKPGAKEPVEKTSYVALFEPWGWVIGTGVYDDDIAAEHDRALKAAGSAGIPIVLLVVGIAFWSAQSLSRRMRRLNAAMAAVAADNLDIEIPDRDRRDEIGVMAKALDLFRRGAVEAKALRQAIDMKSGALDAVRSNVMLADGDYKIFFMNRPQLEMMQLAEPDLRKELPHFDSANLIGKSIDVFHKNPAHQRKMLDTLTTTFETQIKVGVRTFQLIATPLFDGDRRMGTAVEWRDISLEKSIEGDIRTIVEAATKGDFTARVETVGKSGFMLTLANLMNDMCVTIDRALTDMGQMCGAMSAGNLTERITKDYAGNFLQLKEGANSLAGRLSTVISEIKTRSTEVSNAAAEISLSTTDLSQRTEEQAASLEQTSASMEQISATVKKNAESARRANGLTSASRDAADRGGAVAADAVKAMAKIQESSRKIADIITVIDEIARQTNLLALNAAVEAARAGDAGRGFAVVASEVRSLAQRSSQAAKDIKDLITNSSGQVDDGVGLVNQAGNSLNEIVGSIKEVADIIADIATASTEQAEGLEQINKALTQMDEVTQQNSALVEENAAAVKTLEDHSKAMDEKVAFFVTARGGEGGQSGAVAAPPPCRAFSAEAAPAARKLQHGAKPATGLKPARTGGRATALAKAANTEPDWQEF